MKEIIFQSVRMLLVYGAILGLYWLFYRKRPPYLKNPGKGRLPEDCIVCVSAIAKGGVEHKCEYHFTRRKNGKYRMKYSAFDAVITLLVVGIFTAAYVWLLYRDWDAVCKYPEVAAGYVMIGIGFLLLSLLLLMPQVIAKTYFRSVLREYRKSKEQNH